MCSKYRKGLHWIIGGDTNDLKLDSILQLNSSLKQVVTSHCIYAVTCQKGGKPGTSCGTECQYIGLTKIKAKVRWGEHKSSAKPLLQQTSKPVGKHFSGKGHEIHDMSFEVIEEVRSQNPFILKARESFWIKQYDNIGN